MMTRALLRRGALLATTTVLATVGVLGIAPPAHARQDDGQIHAGVCRSGNCACHWYEGCFEDPLTDLLIIAGLVLLTAVCWEMLVAVAALDALPIAAEVTAVAEGSEAVALTAEVTEVAEAAEATVEATTEATVETTTAASEEVTATATAAADATAAEDTAAGAGENLIDVAEGNDVIPQEVYNDYPALRDVNPGGFNDNCVACSNASREIVGGGLPAQAGDTGFAGFPEIEGPNGSFANEMSFQDMERQLLAAGDGTDAGVVVQPPGGGPGHAFNAINRQGQVVWFDTQATVARTTAEIVSRFGRWTSWFVP
jgi:hypothetical protein